MVSKDKSPHDQDKFSSTGSIEMMREFARNNPMPEPIKGLPYAPPQPIEHPQQAAAKRNQERLQQAQRQQPQIGLPVIPQQGKLIQEAQRGTPVIKKGFFARIIDRVRKIFSKPETTQPVQQQKINNPVSSKPLTPSPSIPTTLKLPQHNSNPTTSLKTTVDSYDMFSDPSSPHFIPEVSLPSIPPPPPPPLLRLSDMLSTKPSTTNYSDSDTSLEVTTSDAKGLVNPQAIPSVEELRNTKNQLINERHELSFALTSFDKNVMRDSYERLKLAELKVKALQSHIDLEPKLMDAQRRKPITGEKPVRVNIPSLEKLEAALEKAKIHLKEAKSYHENNIETRANLSSQIHHITTEKLPAVDAVINAKRNVQLSIKALEDARKQPSSFYKEKGFSRENYLALCERKITEAQTKLITTTSNMYTTLSKVNKPYASKEIGSSLVTGSDKITALLDRANASSHLDKGPEQEELNSKRTLR